MGSTTVIDAHAHILPPSVGDRRLAFTWKGNPVERAPDGRLRTSSSVRPDQFKLTHEGGPEAIDARLREMDSLGVDMQILSLSPSFWMYGVPSHDIVEAAKRTNDDLMAIAAAHPTRFRVFVHLPLDDIDAAVTELERTMKNEYVVGAAVGTNIGGRSWDDQALSPILSCAEDREALLFLHPHTALRPFHLGNLVVNPTDTTLAIGSLIFSGAYDRLPELRTLFAHGGGYACFASSRFDHAHAVRPELSDLTALAPSEYLKRMYFDSLVHGPEQLQFLVETVGSDRVVLGTDYPADMGPSDPVGQIRGASSLSRAEQDAILGQNLVAMLGLERVFSD